MLPPEQPDRIHVAFDDRRLVANAGLLLPVTRAHYLGLGELVDRHVDLGLTPGRANAYDKVLTLVASALAGGNCIDAADVMLEPETTTPFRSRCGPTKATQADHDALTARHPERPQSGTGG